MQRGGEGTRRRGGEDQAEGRRGHQAEGRRGRRRLRQQQEQRERRRLAGWSFQYSNRPWPYLKAEDGGGEQHFAPRVGRREGGGERSREREIERERSGTASASRQPWVCGDVHRCGLAWGGVPLGLAAGGVLAEAARWGRGRGAGLTTLAGGGGRRC